MPEEYIEEERNFENIENQALREEIDGKYNQAHDELSATYYNYWKKGESAEWKGYNKGETEEESKIIFDNLHSLIFIMRDLEYNTRLEDTANTTEAEVNILELKNNGYKITI